MRRNPKGDWTIGNIERICREYGMSCRPPSGGGSHYKISHPNVRDILTVPAHRPIKPVYIRKLLQMIELAGKK